MEERTEKKSIEQMNIEELRAALHASEDARIELEKAFKVVSEEAKRNFAWFQDEKADKEKIKNKVDALKAVISIL